jgi:hypothetical protein
MRPHICYYSLIKNPTKVADRRRRRSSIDQDAGGGDAFSTALFAFSASIAFAFSLSTPASVFIASSKLADASAHVTDEASCPAAAAS